ncbi:MAG: hypothetical protein U0T75_10780 [Chitinophagales bacterium]
MKERLASVFRLNAVSSLQLFQLIRYGSFLLVGVLFAKLQLPQTSISQFEWIIMMAGFLSFFWVSGVINSMLSLYPRRNEQERGVLLFNTFLLLTAFSAVVAVGVLLAYELHLLAFRDILVLVAFYNIVNAPAFLTEYVLFLHKQNKALLAYGFITGLLTLVGLGICALQATGVVNIVPIAGQYFELAALLLLGVVALVKWLVLLSLLGKHGTFKVDFNLLKTHLLLALPIMLTLLVSGSAEYIDGLIVNARFHGSFFAVYRYGAKELPILLIIANTFSTAMIPSIAADLQQGLDELKVKSTRLMHLFFPITIVLLVVSPLLYYYVFSENFVYSAVIFNIYLLLAIPRVLFPQTIIMGLQHSRYQLVSAVLEITLNVSLSLWLSYKIGLPGIALGTFIAYCFDKAFLIAINKWKYGISPSKYINLPVFIGYTLTTLAAFALGFRLFQSGFWGF